MGMIRERYDALVRQGEICEDPAQLAMVARYDALLLALAQNRQRRNGSVFHRLFSRRKAEQHAVKGLYIYGEVGRGKTMLMDLFFSCLPEGDKRRAHFNDFMNDVHDRIKAHRQALERGETKQDNPFPDVAAALAREAHIVCFDEFAVTDIADAMILSRLFTALFQKGVVLVATSNVAPQELYRDGLNRQLFLPFITTLQNHVEVINLDAPTDYRLEKAGRQPVYVTPLNGEADAHMDTQWARATEGAADVSPATLSVRGRVVDIPLATGSAARFDFSDLCSKPLSAYDYIALAARYRTFFVDHVPVLDDTRRHEAKRFILLIDTLYDHHVRLFMSAAARPDKLYTGRMQTAETFEFERTVSRLFEMQSDEYLRDWTSDDPRKK